MIRLGTVQWSLAILLSLLFHIAIFSATRPAAIGTADPPAGTPVAVATVLAGVLGSESAEVAEVQEALQPVTNRDVLQARTSSETPVAALQAVEPIPVDRVENARPAPKGKADERTRLKKPEDEAKRKNRSSKAATNRGGQYQGAAGSTRGGRNGTGSASPGAVQAYAAMVRARILSNRPSGSGQGQVLIAFGLTQSGGISYARIARSSGSASLNQAALSAVRLSSPFPSPPVGAMRSQLRFSIAFSFN